MSPPRVRAALAAGLMATAVAAGCLTAGTAQATTGPAVTDGTYDFTARLTTGDDQRACSGVLVDARWVATAASCFADDLGAGPVAAGKPKWKTTAVLGASPDAGNTFDVVEIAPRTDRDVVLARLDRPADAVTVPFATTAPTAGEELTAVGFGRTKDAWVPDTRHTAAFTVQSVSGTTLALDGKTDDDAICAGDAGGPLLRQKDGKFELVALASQSWQGGCWGSDPAETRNDAVSPRLDDAALRTWVRETREQLREVVYAADVSGDGRSDLVVLSKDGEITVRTARATVATRPGDPLYHFNPPVHRSAGWSNFLGQEGKGRLYFADVNGDNKADLIVHETNGDIAVRTNKGTYFDSGTHWSAGWSNFLGHEGKGRLYFADINGDNKADLIVHETNGDIAVRTNKGTYFDSGTHWSAGWSNFLGHEGKGRLYFADINGDNKADLIVHETNGDIAVRTNKGTYFDSGTHWSAGWSNFLGHPKGGLHFADVNADGKADLLVRTADGRIEVRRNTGTYFQLLDGDDWV
ncbi:FG-GAP-like repeat-containing protein [Streptomyces lienomycini]|uniref:FG-GAP-like repeat-containing protein n=2 Tax=Streptomyces lienomycini TaxID=284035 RepID=A0ABV9WYL5_9ACTN|nr:FG-GAP-like repeat-containing protein [Streptomyces lienomycini]